MDTILLTKPQKDYELLDSGEGYKLERYGSVVVSRPDPQALWPKRLDQKEWDKAEAVFSKSGWKIKSTVPKKWNIELGGLHFVIKLSSFKHTGVFPEQIENWKWIEEKIKNSQQEKFQVLNLFGYTGGATLAASKAGAEVVHVDGSKVAITTAKENADLSGLGQNKIRWIVDDARAFVKREIKRGNTYHGIIMDPPAFGRGPKGEVWKIEEDFLELIELCKNILAPTPSFILINGYASGYSAIAYKNSLEIIRAAYPGTLSCGEVGIEESQSDRILPAGIYARYSQF